jgi:hypothetical protein
VWVHRLSGKQMTLHVLYLVVFGFIQNKNRRTISKLMCMSLVTNVSLLKRRVGGFRHLFDFRDPPRSPDTTWNHSWAA